MTTLHLEVNDAGGWRRVMSFDARESGDVESHANWLFGCSDNERLKARIIAPGTTVPMLVWSRAGGWVKWENRGSAA